MALARAVHHILDALHQDDGAGHLARRGEQDHEVAVRAGDGDRGQHGQLWNLHCDQDVVAANTADTWDWARPRQLLSPSS